MDKHRARRPRNTTPRKATTAGIRDLRPITRTCRGTAARTRSKTFVDPVTTANVDTLRAARSKLGYSPLTCAPRGDNACAPSLPGAFCPPPESEASIKMSRRAASIDLDFSLKGGTTAGVTGGTASGVGAAICEAFAVKAAKAAIVDINAGAAAAEANKIGAGAVSFACDVAEPALGEPGRQEARCLSARFRAASTSSSTARASIFSSAAEELPARLLGRDDQRSISKGPRSSCSQAVGQAMIAAGTRRQDAVDLRVARRGSRRHRPARRLLRVQVRSHQAFPERSRPSGASTASPSIRSRQRWC